MTQPTNLYPYNGSQNLVNQPNMYNGIQPIDQNYSYDPRTMIVQRTQPQNQDNLIPVMRLPHLSDARKYPVAPGNGITFFIDNEPYVCTKTLGNTGLDQPVFRKWRLVEEPDDGVTAETYDNNQNTNPINKEVYEKEMESLKSQIEKLEKSVSEIQLLKDRLKKVEDSHRDHKQNWRNKQQ